MGCWMGYFDGVDVTEDAAQVFRALRLWHSSTSACSACLSPVGSIVQCSPLR